MSELSRVMEEHDNPVIWREEHANPGKWRESHEGWVGNKRTQFLS